MFEVIFKRATSFQSSHFAPGFEIVAIYTFSLMNYLNFHSIDNMVSIETRR